MSGADPHSKPSAVRLAELEAENARLDKELAEARQALAVREEELRAFRDRGPPASAGGGESGEGSPSKGRAMPEADLRQALERSRDLLESIGEAFYLLDRDWRFQHISRKGLDIVGKQPGELLGHRLLEVFPKAEGGDSHRAMQRAMESGEPQHLEAWSEYLSRWMEVDIQPGPTGLSVAFRDIHKRKVAEQQLEVARTELAEDLVAMVRLNQFSSKLMAADALPNLLEEALEGVMLLQHADFGKVQLYDKGKNTLQIAAQKGFSETFLTRFAEMDANVMPGIERLQARQRVTVEDIESDSTYDANGMREVALAEGFHAVQSTPLFDHSGEFLGIITTHFRERHRLSERELHLTDLYARQISDMIAGGLAKEALRASEERFRAIVGQATVGICETDVNGRIRYVNDRYCEILGRSRDSLLKLGLLDITYLDDIVYNRVLLDRLFAEGESFALEKRYLRGDGSLVWVSKRVAPLRDAEGRIKGGLAVAIDISERKLATEALAESERRLRTLIENIPQLVWRALRGGEWTWASPQWCDYTGLSEAESLQHRWLQAVHPDDREHARAAWTQADADGRFEAEYRLRQARDSRYRAFQTRATPVRDEKGEVVEWLGTSTDIDDLRKLQEHQRLLVAELQHRVRNILAVVRSIARRTAATSETAEDYAAHLDGRLNALARTQSVLTRDPISGVDLEELVSEEVLAHSARQDEQVEISGPSIRLRPKAAETLSLAMHELATNAVKYGALSGNDGHITATWRMEGEGNGEAKVVFVWTETGVEVQPTDRRRRGFGTELLERTLRYELGAETALQFGEDCLRCTISLPAKGVLVGADRLLN